jgi:hypothetical protein
LVCNRIKKKSQDTKNKENFKKLKAEHRVIYRKNTTTFCWITLIILWQQLPNVFFSICCIVFVLLDFGALSALLIGLAIEKCRVIVLGYTRK